MIGALGNMGIDWSGLGLNGPPETQAEKIKRLERRVKSLENSLEKETKCFNDLHSISRNAYIWMRSSTSFLLRLKQSIRGDDERKEKLAYLKIFERFDADHWRINDGMTNKELDGYGTIAHEYILKNF